MKPISDLEEAEDQYQMALRTHLENVDDLIQLNDSRLYSLEKSFQQELKIMQSDFLAEKESMLTKFSKEKKELVAVIDAIEHEENEKDGEVIYFHRIISIGYIFHYLHINLSIF